MEIVIEKILKLTSKRKDILEKIVMANSDSVQDILIKNGKTRLILCIQKLHCTLLPFKISHSEM